MSTEIRGPVWIRTNKDGTVSVGLTAQYIRDRACECFHIMQADTEEVWEGQPMLVMETNDGMETVKSPVTGRVLVFNDRARDFPDKLKEEESILTLLPKGVEVQKTKSKPSKTENNFEEQIAAQQQQWFQQFNAQMQQLNQMQRRR